MTAEQIEALTGHELDAAVAVHVMSWHRSINDGHSYNDVWDDGFGAVMLRVLEWTPSVCGKQMLTVLARLRTPDADGCYFLSGLHECVNGWVCSLRKYRGGLCIETHASQDVGNSPGEALCRAALLAVQGKESVP